MAQTKDFRNEPLEDMVAVGRVEAHSARLWMRTERPGRVKVRWWKSEGEDSAGECTADIPQGNDSDNTYAVTIPGEDSGERLSPLCRYRFRIFDSDRGRLVGEGSFETAPESPGETPDRFSLAVFSCHQPFDESGKVRESSGRMLRAALKCLDEHRTKFVLMVGDQMYSDFPESLSLFDSDYFPRIAPAGRKTLHDCSSEEVRRIYQRRYRHFWNHPDWKNLQARYPCYPILDDHDIVDNWGARPVYETPHWKSIGEGARRAYFDYQARRMMPPVDGGVPPSFHTSFSYGNTATFIMDLRSERRAGDNGRLYSLEQEVAFRDFLSRHEDKKVLFLVLSVPVVHLPRFLAKFVSSLPHTGEDFSDRWSSGAHVKDRDTLLKIIQDHQCRHPSQRFVLLSGDIHIGCVHVIRWNNAGSPLYQMISSPITHHTGFALQLASKAIIQTNRHILTDDERLSATVRPLRGEGGLNRNPYGKMNLGLVEVETPHPDSDSTIRFLLYGNRNGEPVCVFRSPAI